MAATRAKNVINLLQAPPPTEPRQILLQVKFAAIDRVALTQIGFNLFSTNDKMIGAISTEQFSVAALQPVAAATAAVGQTVNFSDLLNLFAFRPDLNIGATIKALQETQSAADSGRAEPDHGGRQGGHVSWRAAVSRSRRHHHPTGGATAPVITVQFKPFGVKLDFTPTVTPRARSISRWRRKSAASITPMRLRCRAS